MVYGERLDKHGPSPKAETPQRKALGVSVARTLNQPLDVCGQVTVKDVPSVSEKQARKAVQRSGSHK